jgi:hypothetical protein
MGKTSVIADAADYWGRHTKKTGGLSAKTPRTKPGFGFCGHPAVLFYRCACRNSGGIGAKPECGVIRFLVWPKL